MRGRLVVCGNLVQDILVHPVAEPLAWGTTVTVEQIIQSLGGNGGTTSFTLATLGVPVTLMSLAGRDAAASYCDRRQGDPSRKGGLSPSFW